MTQRLPALFLGHGSPMTTISDVPERRAWAALGQTLPRPEAILVISAHWETRGRIHLSAGDAPRTIHDFGGFPAELYTVQYPAPGSAALIDRIEALLGEDRIERDESWGFDHGAWGVVLPMFPQADIPMVEMSLDRAMDPAALLELGRSLAPLRDEGVLIIGSGNIVHNLRLWRQFAGTRPDWAVSFQDRINDAVRNGDNYALTAFAPDDRAAADAINSAEHYLPLLPIVGARLPGDDVGVFNDSVDGALSMTSYLVGDTALLPRAA
ncbi:4,5-DOPA dioxygenase extradiol [Novosphingobium aquiterrae]|uniref:4,5-DOPA dioxygenase extradiol n=1 Tax=Novosphingobium aquiterrae TaxID=624388 RepID=A0ABV6PH19_9SPHN